MLGDAALLEKVKKARANFGCATPDFIQAAAITAWNDDNHVKERRKIFTDRINASFPVFKNLGMIEQSVETTFYLWCTVPKKWNGDDIKFTLDLAEQGVICSPSTWLSENIGGYVRFALVPEMEDMMKALRIIEKMVASS
jgi:aspartate/methionine/tyrosine aminotransferase